MLTWAAPSSTAACYLPLHLSATISSGHPAASLTLNHEGQYASVLEHQWRNCFLESLLSSCAVSLVVAWVVKNSFPFCRSPSEVKTWFHHHFLEALNFPAPLCSIWEPTEGTPEAKVLLWELLGTTSLAAGMCELTGAATDGEERAGLGMGPPERQSPSFHRVDGVRGGRAGLLLCVPSLAQEMHTTCWHVWHQSCCLC